tara:strand:+ start:264 stop:1511 length:1248 start_codon:yes stop_codon:yes gene_type:complete
MSISYLQDPGQVCFSQSPLVYAVSESNAEAYTSSSFQYVMEVKYWEGNRLSVPTVSNYTLQKYPNISGSGIFDLSRIATSLFTEPRAAESSSVYNVKVDSYIQFQTSPSSSFFTGSHVGSSAIQVFDGYQLFQDNVQGAITNGPIVSSSVYWPIMSDGPASQSYFRENYGRMSLWTGQPTNAKYIATGIVYSSSFDGEDQAVVVAVSSSNESGNCVQTFPISPNEPDWPLDNDPNSIGNFEIFLVSGSTENYDGTNRITDRLHFDLECTKKYPNIRIKWKNRFGQWDNFNFNLVSQQSFNTQRSRYQPQIGTWDSRTLSYEDYESAIQNYITDSTLKLSVNTDYVNEDYNEIFKQLMVSDEIYWVYEEGSEQDGTEKVKPLAIDDSTFNLKTNVVDKLIQYSFRFTQGQGYKLIF